jgi:serine/threonine protein kinase
VPVLFRYLLHGSAAVREHARRSLQAIGWEKSLAAVENLARRADAAAAVALLDGLAVFEARSDLVRLLDRLVDVLQGDLRVRALQLLEHKRLGLDLEKTTEVFRQVRSPFRLHKVLGQGLFTSAYLARDDGMDLEVVVRVLRPEFVGRPEIRCQFLELCRKAIHYHHPNLAHTLEVRAFAEQDVYYIVRQYIPGVTLQGVLAAGRCLEPPQVLEVLRQLLQALAVLHPNGVAHGAIKPSNVFLCSGDRVVLGDLSLPPQGMGEELHKRLAYDYRYAAPEALVGNAAGPACDFYALGCVAYELICGAPPFVSDHYNDVLVQQVTRPVPPPRRHCPDLARAVEHLLLRLLEKDAGRRPASVDEALGLVDTVARALRDEGQRSRTDLTAAPAKPPAAEEPSGARLLRDSSLDECRPMHTLFSMGSSRPIHETVRPQASSLAPGASSSEERLASAAVPGYEVLELIGRGGMGVVYKARHVGLQRIVALKMILHAAHARDAERARFLREARATASLRHPNIVQVYDVGEHDGCPYISLEFMEGGTLVEKLHHGPLEPAVAAGLLLQVAQGVQAAHQHGVIHRDLKPANILLTADGQARIGDFGLAKIQNSEVLTAPGVLMGTPQYMPPEQAAGHGANVGPAADIYALGAILYECLTGGPPFRGSMAVLLHQLMHEDPVPPHRLQPTVPHDLEVICLKCLEKDPARRYADAAALAQDLQRFLDGQAITARPISAPERAWRAVRRRPTLKAFLWLAALASAAAALWQALR